ncbi:single-stranded DNA-binding protein [Leucobacter sp. GX24907]
MAGEPQITIIGSLGADPEPRVSQAGRSWVTFNVASAPRVKNRETDQWEDGETIWFNCRAYGEYADNIAASLTKGTRVIVQGRLSQRAYTDKQGNPRTSLDLEVDEIGPALRWATASVTRGGNGPAGGGYAKTGNGQQPAYGNTQGGGYGQGQPAWGSPAAQQDEGQQSFGSFDDEQPF